MALGLALSPTSRRPLGRLQVGQHCGLHMHSGDSARGARRPALGDEEGCPARLRAASFCARAVCTRAKSLSGNPFGCKHEAETGRLLSVGETALHCPKRLSPTCVLIARDAQSSKHSHRCVLVEGGLAYATNETARPQALRRSLSVEVFSSQVSSSLEPLLRTAAPLENGWRARRLWNALECRREDGRVIDHRLRREKVMEPVRACFA